MGFTWDEAKRQRVLAIRGVDFVDLAAALFDGRTLLTIPGRWQGEVRFISVGMIGEKSFAIVWTSRDGQPRLITARRARNAEERQYRKLFS